MPDYRILPVTDAKTKRAFLAAPGAVLKDNPNFTAPLTMDAKHRLEPAKHPFYGHGEAAFWVALNSDGRPVGRISAQINQRHQDRYGKGGGHFGCIAGEDDPALYRELLRTAEAWLKERGCNLAIGPASLSVNEEFGLLVDGFDTPSMLLMGYDPTWAGGHIEAAGYTKAKDLIAYRYDPRQGLPRRVTAFAAKLEKVDGARIRCFDKRAFDHDLAAVLAVFNDAWSENWGYVPMSEKEIKALADAFKMIADYGLIFIVEINGRPVGMAASLPNVNEALSGLGGASSPLALLKFLWRLKVRKPKSARILLMGVVKDIQADLALRPLVSMTLVKALGDGHAERGYENMEMSWILEDNIPMRRIAESGGAEAYKTYRVYQKALL